MKRCSLLIATMAAAALMPAVAMGANPVFEGWYADCLLYTSDAADESALV